ncbi:hypothetical protein DOTSEDRAFT_70838 [Dothistroma septosporum NZE10]|uniref:Ubiquitin carboxyl-terminal hydrolase 19 n=1 Tax=Dothistroma septosporum (strain NZE10 / CBS 128990) TaxID=675120 RepID=N1PNB8_DOTSN|nr:hypothetical protein DOTSEDRAFT_70838 [Dothistroma septosporum NZE10]
MMDPQSQSFTPQYSSSSDSWRLQTDVARIQQIQAEHADRIARLERTHENDARMKSVWGSSSPFPSVLTGTPQTAPLQQPPGEQFRGFDDDTSNMISSLHLDAEDEPRRALGASSRANSVRFDESANQNHFSHSSRSSVELLSRAGSGFGGIGMNERTPSHKSEGRASSAHSTRSVTSGRANSLNLDTAAFSLGSAHRSPTEAPGITPGMLLLGAVPAIIRCWMNTNFKHDALLYAAVCTGSYKSFLDLRLIENLGFEQNIRTNDDSLRTVELPIFFPEAVTHPASSRSGSPAPQLPSLQVEFRVVEIAARDDDKAIQIFLGSDVLRAHNADILFSSNSMTLFDDDRNKLSIPLSRPENEAVFNSLYVTTGAHPSSSQDQKTAATTKEHTYLNGLGRGSSTASVSSAAASPPTGKYRPPGAVAAEAGQPEASKLGTVGSERESRPTSRASNVPRPSLTLLNTKRDSEENKDAGAKTAPLRNDSTPAIWGSWRRDPPASASTQPTSLDWANAGRSQDASYQRKDTGIKVLKPKTATRNFSTTATAASGTASPGDGKSRFFDEGRRRSLAGSDAKSSTSGKEIASATAHTPAPPKTKVNPVGGASAFSWLNPGGSK